jgi:hypothetical protein
MERKDIQSVLRYACRVEHLGCDTGEVEHRFTKEKYNETGFKYGRLTAPTQDLTDKLFALGRWLSSRGYTDHGITLDYLEAQALGCMMPFPQYVNFANLTEKVVELRQVDGCWRYVTVEYPVKTDSNEMTREDLRKALWYYQSNKLVTEKYGKINLRQKRYDLMLDYNNITTWLSYLPRELGVPETLTTSQSQ